VVVPYKRESFSNEVSIKIKAPCSYL